MPTPAIVWGELGWPCHPTAHSFVRLDNDLSHKTRGRQPNPFRTSALIRFELPGKAHVTLKVGPAGAVRRAPNSNTLRP